jgi:hypothetical protein
MAEEKLRIDRERLELEKKKTEKEWIKSKGANKRKTSQNQEMAVKFNLQ